MIARGKFHHFVAVYKNITLQFKYSMRGLGEEGEGGEKSGQSKEMGEVGNDKELTILDG